VALCAIAIALRDNEFSINKNNPLQIKNKIALESGKN